MAAEMSNASKNETSTRLTNSTYNIIHALEKDAEFLYSVADRYAEDARKDSRADLVNVWNTIKQDKQKHVQMLKEALAREAKDDRLK